MGLFFSSPGRCLLLPTPRFLGSITGVAYAYDYADYYDSPLNASSVP